jgi:alkylation response protein AidB-like acyl-CoA dehydrogenase
VAPQGAVLTAAFQAGIAARCVEMATEYSLARKQFDRPDRVVPGGEAHARRRRRAAEVARTAVHAAAVTLDDPDVGDVDRADRGAKLLAGEAALKNAKTSLQVHGGHGLHVGGRRAPLPEAGLGARHRVRLRGAHADEIAAGLPAA